MQRRALVSSDCGQSGNEGCVVFEARRDTTEFNVRHTVPLECVWHIHSNSYTSINLLQLQLGSVTMVAMGQSHHEQPIFCGKNRHLSS